MRPFEFYAQFPLIARLLFIIGMAVIGHFLINSLQWLVGWIVLPGRRLPGTTVREDVARRFPKVATVLSLTSSSLTFTLYFVALGLILHEFEVSLTAYLATASVLGLAIAFGSQGLVQDVVIGLTLVFSDAFDIGDVIEVSGQIGRVERVGLRFTTLVNFHGQRVYIPNRNISLVACYRRGSIRAYVDIQLPAHVDIAVVTQTVDAIANGMRAQHGSIIVTDPETFGVFEAKPGGWRYLRIKFRLWPGQGALIESTFRQRVVVAMQQLDGSFADWTVTVTYRVD
jgi:small-conductance mechanosensitive channel